MGYLVAVGCGLTLLVGTANAQQLNQYVIDPPIQDQTVATAALHYRFTPPLADRLNEYVDSPLKILLDDPTHTTFPPTSQWRAFISHVMQVMWHLAAARPTATTGCVRLIERPPPGARDRYGNLLRSEIPGSRVWVGGLDKVRRYQAANFYASDIEEIRWITTIGMSRSCPQDPNVDQWSGTNTGAFPTDRRPTDSPYLSTEQLTRLRYILRDGVSCPADLCESSEGILLEPVDLNDDGKMEYIATGDVKDCGSGGCGETLVMFQETMWVRLAEHFGSMEVLTTKTKGYRDIVLGWTDYRWDVDLRWRGVRFAWNGFKYVETDQRGELSVVRGYDYRPPTRAALINPPPRSPDERDEVAAIQRREATVRVDVPSGRPATPKLSVQDYHKEVKRRIEEKWVYPQEASRKGQTGVGMAKFVIRPDGTVKEIEIVNSTGTMVLDRYIENAIRMAAPFPHLPAEIQNEPLTLTAGFTYVLGGNRSFGYR